MQVITFDLNNQPYAIQSETVEEITKLVEITPVPNAPDYIEGLINLRGNVISLIHLSRLLHIESDGYNYNNIVIVNIKNETLGMLVGEVKEVMNIEEDQIEKVGLEEDQNAVKGIIQINDQIVNYLDLEECILL